MEYRVAINLDKYITERLYGNLEDAYKELGIAFTNQGFLFSDGMYVDEYGRDVVEIITSVQQIAMRHTWLCSCVSTIKLLRVESVSDLFSTLYTVSDK